METAARSPGRRPRIGLARRSKKAAQVQTKLRRAAPSAAASEPRFDGLVDQIGHDLRTPLNVIIGFSDMMQRELLGPLGAERYQTYVGHIRDSGFALAKAVEDTLALTRLIAETGAEGAGTADVAAVLRRALACVAPEMEARRLVVERPTVVRLGARGDADALERALVNLLLASVMAAPRGGILRLSLQRARGRVMLAVATAPAASPDTDAAGTELPDTSEPSPPGANPLVPLLIARSLVELQGGTLTVDRVAGRICAASVTLPTGRR